MACKTKEVAMAEGGTGDSRTGSVYVKIKLLSPESKAKGFYLLLTNGNTYSDKEDEFIVERKFLEILRSNNILFEELTSPVS